MKITEGEADADEIVEKWKDALGLPPEIRISGKTLHYGKAAFSVPERILRVEYRDGYGAGDLIRIDGDKGGKYELFIPAEADTNAPIAGGLQAD